jgi:hypothetical protein
LTNFLVKPFRFAVTYLHPAIAGNKVGENNTQLLSCQWPADDDSIQSLVTSTVNMTTLANVIGVIAGLPDTSWNFQELWSCQKNSNGEAVVYTCNGTPIFESNTFAEWVKAAMNLNGWMLFWVVYCGLQANEAAGHLLHKRGGHSNQFWDDIL